MAENSKIEWTDHTFNPWMGCTKVSSACAHCYAERDMDHRYGKVKWGPQGTRVLTSAANWKQPLKWNREAARDGVRRRVFCASLADVFEDWAGPVQLMNGGEVVCCDSCGKVHRDPDAYAECPCSRWLQRADFAKLSDVRRELFALIDATPHLDWLLLTKRPENIHAMWPRCTHCKGNGRIEMLEHCQVCRGRGMEPHRPNVWLGTSVENQEYAELRIPELLKCRDLSPVLFLSCEPLLGPVELQNIKSIDWVIAGGESGPHARPIHSDWFRGLRDQCQAAGVPYFFKQWGEHDESRHRVGKKAAGRLLDGCEHSEFPTTAAMDRRTPNPSEAR